MTEWQGKWTLVTGSSRGIGRQVALGLAEHGCNIIVHGRAEDHCREVLEEVTAHGVEGVVVAGELGTDAGEAALIDAVRALRRPVDILYNNAGVMSPWNDCIFDIPMGAWEQVFRINFFSMVHLCNAFVPGMVERGWGRVVNVTSGMKDQPQLSPYSVSKAAVDKYTLDLAAELQGSGVLVNTMDPGWLRTDLGGPYADHAVDSVLPGALVPVLLDEAEGSGRMYAAQEYHWSESDSGERGGS